MNDCGRNLIRITKTKEQAKYEKSHPSNMYQCPECGKLLKLFPTSCCSTNERIIVTTNRVNHTWTDFLYFWFDSYNKRVFVDKYTCGACGAEWESGRYKCNVRMATEILAEKAI